MSHGQTSAPGLLWRDGGTPVSARFGDIYFSPEDGLAETRHVFLDGTDLAVRWAGRDSFVIGETGFGTGLNFLAAWDLWRRAPRAPARLHYIAVEAYPLSATQLRAAHAAWPALGALSSALCRAYDRPLPGFHRLHLNHGRVHLTLLHGHAEPMLAALDARIDAWFLDGFAPARNPDMWSPAVFAQLARLSAPDTRLATFTVAGAVRRGLTDAGFTVEKAPGFGAKRDMLRGRYYGSGPLSRTAPWFAPAPTSPRPRRTVIVGGGIAGASLAGALRRRGVDALILERHGHLAAEASGNPRGLITPRLTVKPSAAGRFHCAALAYVRRLLASETGAPDLTQGVVQLARDEADWRRQQALVMAQALPLDWMRPLTRREASDLAGAPVTRPGLFQAAAGALDPAALVRHLAGDAPVRQATLTAMAPRADGWRLTLRDAQHAIDTLDADLVIMAHGMAVAGAPGGAALPLRASRGQLSIITETARPLARAVTYGGYAAPLPGGGTVLGATYDSVTDAVDPEAALLAGHQHNLGLCAGLLPLFTGLSPSEGLEARLAIRATTPDHMPVAGPLPRIDCYEQHYAQLRARGPTHAYPQAEYWPHLMTMTGLGSRGLTTAPLLAELVASQVCGDPPPLERDLLASVHPARFLVRALKKGQSAAEIR